MQIRNLAILTLVVAAMAAPDLAAKKKAPTGIYERALIYNKGDEGSKFYRIPAIATAPDGSLLAIADKRWNSTGDLPEHIDVVCRRSTDLGRTWSKAVTIAGEGTDEGYGDPAVVVDSKRKQVVCIMTRGNGLWESTPDNHAYIMVSHSADNGLTWSEPLDITNQLFGEGCTNEATSHWVTAFATSGAATQLKDGRLMFVLVVRETQKKWDKLTVYSCYSDDGGYNWKLSENSADSDADESKVVQLRNGDVMMSIRNRRRGERKFCLSTDRGQTWGQSWTQSDIIEPACNGDIIRYKYGKTNILLHSIPNDSLYRKNVSIFASFDEGKTWPVKRTLCPEGSAYSSMTVLKDGTLGVLTEEAAEGGGWQLWFTRLSPDWLLNQK
jgi:sialidase-1